jgi:nucleoid DNA-binding protein
MNKKDISEILAEKADLQKGKAAEVVNLVFEILAEGLVKYDAVAISGFGTFKKKERKARKGINPKTKESINIAASTSIGFKQASAMKETLNA